MALYCGTTEKLYLIGSVACASEPAVSKKPKHHFERWRKRQAIGC